jgi:transcriptional regulator with XRE-family HTH domain
MSQLPTSPIVGKNLKRHRDAAGLSADEAARRLSDALGKEVQPYIVNRMEKGARPITVDEAEALAEVYGVKAGSLFETDQAEANVRLKVLTARQENFALRKQLVETIKQILMNNATIENLQKFSGQPQVFEDDKWLAITVDVDDSVAQSKAEFEVEARMKVYGADGVLKTLDENPPEYPF